MGIKWDDISKDAILGLIGLATKQSGGSRTLGAFGLLGVGLVAGAAIGLLIAPKPGAELRREVAKRLGVGDDREVNGQALDELIA